MRGTLSLCSLLGLWFLPAISPQGFTTALPSGLDHSHDDTYNVTSLDWDEGDETFNFLRSRQNKPELRVMALGASTVYGVGSSNGNGFRKPLRDQLRYAGYEVNMVGTKRGGTMKDNDCEANSGDVISQVHTASRLSYPYKPNVVVINAGTNDIRGSIAINTAHIRMRDLITDLWDNISPDTVVVMSTLLVGNHQDGEANRAIVNPAYRQLVAEFHQHGRPIYLADMDFIPLSQVPDGIHPNDEGHRKMAAGFWHGIAQAAKEDRIKKPLDADFSSGPQTCQKIAGEGVYAGGRTQLGSGLDDDIYRHNSQNMGTVLSVVSDWDRDQWFFARLFRRDRDDLVGWFDAGNGVAKYGVWRNDGGGKFTKIDDMSTGDNCIPRGVHFVDLNGDGLDDFACVAPDGSVFAAINRGNGGGSSPPSFNHISLWKASDAAYPQAQVRLADMDGDGRADFIGLSPNGDVRIWRNGWVKDKPEYFQALGLRFPGQNKGDLRGVRFEDINGDGRDDWMWVSNTGATSTFTNSRSCARGKLGDGLNIAWREAFNGNANSGPTHLGGFGDDVRNRIHFARIYGEPQDFGLLGRQDYVYMEHVKEGSKHRFNMRVYKNIGGGSTKLKADGNKYCDMTGNGRADYVWTHSKGEMTIYPNAGRDFIQDGQSYWGPSAVIWRPPRDIERRDLHLADWNGDGKCDIIWTDGNNGNRVQVWINQHSNGNWNWQHLSNPAGSLNCPEKKGLHIDDLPVRFADVTGNGRADYLCIEKDGRTWGWTQRSDGGWDHVDQFKSAKGHDRANLRWGDVNGDGKADTIWTDKFSGDAYVYYNLGRRDIGGSRYEWSQKPEGGPWFAYTGNAAGTCVFYPDLDGNRRVDQHNILGTWTNEAKTWYNVCPGGTDNTGDDGAITDPNLPDYPNKEPDIPALPGNPPVTDADRCPQDPRNFPNFFTLNSWLGNLNTGSPMCIGKWNKGTFPNDIEAWADERCLRWMKIGFTDGTNVEIGKKPGDDGHHRTGRVTWNPFGDKFDEFSLWEGGWNGGLGRIVLEMSNHCQGSSACRLDAGAYWDNPPARYTVQRGSNGDGMLMGFDVRHGDCIDMLAPYMTDSGTEKVILNNFQFEPTFEELNERTFEERNITAIQDSIILANRREKDDVVMSVESYLITEQQHKLSLATEDGRELGAEIGYTIKGEIDVWVAEPSAEFNGKFSSKFVHKNVETSEDTELSRHQARYTARTTVRPGMAARCTITAWKSAVQLRYKATLQHRFKNGKSFYYQVSGMFQNSESSMAVATCEDVPMPDDGHGMKVMEESGTYCSNGRRVAGLGLSDQDLLDACGV